MQVSSESDFELFAKKVKEHTHIAVKKIEDESSQYLIQSEKKALYDIDKYTKGAQSQWEEEYKEREQQEYKNIQSDINREWNTFKKERENRLYEELKQRLEKIFPSLVESFIVCISDKYERGTLIIPKPYMGFVKIQKFDLQESKDERIIFKKENLYIEYSVERIMEELHNDISTSMSFEENIWQV